MFNQKFANIFSKSILIFGLWKICLFFLTVVKLVNKFFDYYRNNFDIFKRNVYICI